MDEEAGFLRAIQDRPDDDTARLVYADWLDDRGDGRAEYLRLECQLFAVQVTITRDVSDDPQPGVVECELLDVHGRRWHILEKTTVVSADHLDAQSVYPRPG